MDTRSYPLHATASILLTIPQVPSAGSHSENTFRYRTPRERDNATQPNTVYLHTPHPLPTNRHLPAVQDYLLPAFCRCQFPFFLTAKDQAVGRFGAPHVMYNEPSHARRCSRF